MKRSRQWDEDDEREFEREFAAAYQRLVEDENRLHQYETYQRVDQRDKDRRRRRRVAKFQGTSK